jgi:hypothetical protein
MAYNARDILLAVRNLRPGLANAFDFDLTDHQDGNGPAISAWYRSDVAQPSQAEIEAVDTDALVKAQATFLARDLLAQLSPADYVNIQDAIGGSPALGLLWSSLLAQGEAPISVSSERFKQGWTTLSKTLGADRSATIAKAVGIPV